jgi:hypothetical protein
MSKMAGKIGSLLCAVGVLGFFIGIFGGPRSFAIGGVVLMAVSLVGFFIEEQGDRKAA